MSAVNIAKGEKHLRFISARASELKALVVEMLESQQNAIGRVPTEFLAQLVAKIAEEIDELRSELMEEKNELTASEISQRFIDLHDYYIVPMLAGYMHALVQEAVDRNPGRSAMYQAMQGLMGKWEKLVSLVLQSSLIMKERLGENWGNCFVDDGVRQFLVNMINSAEIEDGGGAITCPITTTVGVATDAKSREELMKAIDEALK